MNYEVFLARVRDNLEKEGWLERRDFLEGADWVMEKKPGVLERVRVFVAFTKGEGLGASGARRLSEELHSRIEEEPSPSVVVPPVVGVLGPRVGIAVFVFAETEDYEDILSHSKRRSLSKQIHTVGWVADLGTGTLLKHKGIPALRWGGEEIQSALR